MFMGNLLFYHCWYESLLVTKRYSACQIQAGDKHLGLWKLFLKIREFSEEPRFVNVQGILYICKTYFNYNLALWRFCLRLWCCMWFGAWYGVYCARLSANGRVGLSGRTGKGRKGITGMPADGGGDLLECRVGYGMIRTDLSFSTRKGKAWCPYPGLCFGCFNSGCSQSKSIFLNR